MYRALVALFLTATLGACASTPAVRTLAARTQDYAQGYAQATEEVTAAQRTMIRLGHRRLDALELETRAMREETENARQAWAIGGDQRAEAFTNTTNVDVAGVARVLNEATASRAPDTAGALNIAKPLEALAEIAAPPTPREQLEELLMFAGDVQSEVDELNAEAKKAATAASAATCRTPDALATAGRSAPAECPIGPGTVP